MPLRLENCVSPLQYCDVHLTEKHIEGGNYWLGDLRVSQFLLFRYSLLRCCAASVTRYQTTWRHIPEDSAVHILTYS